MKLTATKAAGITLLIILGGILVSQSMGWWKTQKSREPKLIADGEFAGSYDPGDIRGSFYFSEVEDAFTVPSDILARAFGLPLDTVDTGTYQTKILEGILGDFVGSMEVSPELEAGLDYEIGTDSVRWFTALFNGLPYDPEETTLLPLRALDLLLQEGKIDTEEYSNLQSHAVSLDDIAGLDIHEAVFEYLSLQPPTEDSLTGEAADSEADSSGGTESDTEGTESPREIPEIRGNTTFNDLLDYGITEGQIAETLGIADFSDIDSRMAVRDYCLENGLEFGDYRLKFEELATE
ncbi:MAG: hypothetical protein K9L75_06750 [Spirochaetia bacterium]|nr:hypothetical protein [Spirochaetia bacterium]